MPFRRIFKCLTFSMASHQQTANKQFPLTNWAGGAYGGAPPISHPQARAAMQRQAVGNIFQKGHPGPLQPQPPSVSRPAEFQHGSRAGTQGVDHRTGRAERSSTVSPNSMRPSMRCPRSRDRTGTVGPPLTPAGPQTRGE